MKKIIKCIVLLNIVIYLLGCGNSKKTNIEIKNNIEIHTDKEAFIIEIEDFFSKMPEGFIDELLVRDENSNRKIKIYVEETKDDITCKWDAESGFTWIIDADSRADWQLGFCMMEAIIKNISMRGLGEDFLRQWQQLNPDGFSYLNDEEYEEYMYNGDKLEDSYFTTDKKPSSFQMELAGIMCLLVSEDVNLNEVLLQAPHIRDKFKYLCEEIDRAFETVNGKTYWSRYFY